MYLRYILFLMLGMVPGAWCMLGEHYTLSLTSRSSDTSSRVLMQET